MSLQTHTFIIYFCIFFGSQFTNKFEASKTRIYKAHHNDRNSSVLSG